MTRLRLPVLLLVGLVLAGCGSEPVPDQLAAPAVLPSPSTSANAMPPVEVTPPPAAQPEESVPAVAPSPAVEGNPSAAEVAEVEQFIRDYYEAINRALDSGDVASVEAFSIPQCNCRRVAEFIRTNFPTGRIEGSRTVVREVAVQAAGAEAASVLVDSSTPDGRVVGPDGQTVLVIDNGELGDSTYALTRTPSGWQIMHVVEG